MSGDTDSVATDDVPFFTHDSGPLLARLYRPKDRAPTVAVVSLHGGRWIQETRLTNQVIDHALAEAGALVMAIDVRLPPVARYPDCVADVNVAIRWLKTHAQQYGLPAAAKIGGMGTSSGGHQVMLSALRPHDPRYATLPLDGGADASLAFVVLGWPVIDPLARYRYAEAGNKKPYLEAHHAYWPSVDDMGEGNPQLIVERGEKTPLPPVLLVQGAADEALTPDMADRFTAAYGKAGGTITLAKFDGQPHTFITKKPESAASLDGIARIVAFVRVQTA